MNILLFGKNGQVGWELQRALAPLGRVVALDRNSTEYVGDLTDLDGIAATIKALAPDVIVNAAAYTAVDKAEADAALADCINHQAVAVMAQAAKLLGALLVHYSTDYVFDGSGDAAWVEQNATAPLSVYGQSKLAGENAILASGCAHLIFRTSWVYAARGSNFAKTMLRLAAEREQLNVISDQIGAPTGAELISDVTAHAIRATLNNPALGGEYHLAAAGETSWHGYAQCVIDTARAQGRAFKVKAIHPIPTTQYPTPATRPLNSRLNTEKLAAAFELNLPDWQTGVARMLEEIKPHE
ncbi:MAG: dTDP-4-dehydrorhamnose reductase [Halothiobacillaceae bacterium]